MKQLPLVASFVLFIALCVSIAYWGMQLFKPPARQVTAPPQAVQQEEVRIDAAAGLLGGRAAAAAVASNFQLRGVVMSGTQGESIAILAADGKPATATQINKDIMPGVTVKEVHPRYVVLSEHGIPKRVELPQDPNAQPNMLTVVPPGTRPAPSAPSTDNGNPPVLSAPPAGQAPGPGGGPMPGYAGTPPVMQTSPGMAPGGPNQGMGSAPSQELR